jgi:hypothetical protein
MGFQAYDIIGDIHGHADELVKLLSHLEYQDSSDGYFHESRKVIFLGDFIDRVVPYRLVFGIGIGTPTTDMLMHGFRCILCRVADIINIRPPALRGPIRFEEKTTR